MSDNFWPVIEEDSIVPKYMQIVNAFIDGVKAGKYPSALQIPSLNEMTEISGASKETVYKAYAYLSKVGAIKSHHGKGYFISGDFFNNERSVLVLLPEANPNMMTVLQSLWETLGSYAKVTTVFHNQNPELLKKYLCSEYGRYNYYLVFPHFPADKVPSSQVASILKHVPADNSIIVDRYLPNLSQEYGMVYQYIYADVMGCLEKVSGEFSRFGRLRSVPIYSALYGSEIEDALRTFCSKIHFPYEKSSGVPDNLSKGDLLFIYGCTLGSSIVLLSKKIDESGLVPGKDIGIICYDDFQVNEIILGGLTTMSVDYSQMGKETAKMILRGEMGRFHCKFNLVRRNSF